MQYHKQRSMNSSTRTTQMTTTPSPNDSRTTSMHLHQHPSTMRNPHHYLVLRQNFKSILNNTVTTQHGISSLRQNFMRQCVNGIGTRLMGTLLLQQCAQTNGSHYHQIHIMIRALSIPMHLQRHPEHRRDDQPHRRDNSNV